MNKNSIRLASLISLALLAHLSFAAEFHVAVTGSDNNDGSAGHPFRTISAAARVAQPGDVITIHQGTYRERVTPPRGGESDSSRIVDQAAPGENAVIKGSEVISNLEAIPSWRAEGQSVPWSQ